MGLKTGPYTVWQVPVVDSSNLLHFDDNRITDSSGATADTHGTGTGSGELWFVVDDAGAVQQIRFGSNDNYFPQRHEQHPRHQGRHRADDRQHRRRPGSVERRRAVRGVGAPVRPAGA